MKRRRRWTRRERGRGEENEMQDILNMALPQWELLPDIGLYMDQVITLMDRTFSRRCPRAR